MIISIVTATFNRADLIRGLYNSLLDQHYNGIEWIVVDDGGTDRTDRVLADFACRAPFPIRFLRTENRGKGAAVNHGMDLATGDLVCIVDDDDAFLPGVLQKVAQDYASIAEDSSVAGLSYLTLDPQGRIWGRRFPRDRMLSDHYRCRVNGRVWGDKCEFTKGSLLRAKGIRYVTGRAPSGFGADAVFFFKVADSGQTLYINMPVLVKEYQADGISVNWRKKSLENPELSAQYYAAHLGPKIAPWIRLRYMVAYLAITHFAGKSIAPGALEAPWNRVFLCLAYLPGIWLGTRWKRYRGKGYPVSTRWLRGGLKAS